MARKERILVQRLDHNCDPVPDSFLIFHTAPARSGQFRRNRKTSLLTLYHVPLTRRILGLQKQPAELGQVQKPVSPEWMLIQPAHPLSFSKGADYNSSIH